MSVVGSWDFLVTRVVHPNVALAPREELEDLVYFDYVQVHICFWPKLSSTIRRHYHTIS